MVKYSGALLHNVKDLTICSVGIGVNRTKYALHNILHNINANIYGYSCHFPRRKDLMNDCSLIRKAAHCNKKSAMIKCVELHM